MTLRSERFIAQPNKWGEAAVDRMVSDERIQWIARSMVQHEPWVRAWLSRRPLAGLEIDDIIQDCYTRLIRVRDQDAIRDHRAYFRRTAWSVLVSHVRRERVIPLQMMADVNELGMISDEPGPEQFAADREELHRLAAAIASLPPHLGEVFRLRRVEGLSQKEVAEKLGLAESTIEKHLRKSLLLLLKRFARGGNGPRDASSKYEEGSQSVNDDEHISVG